MDAIKFCQVVHFYQLTLVMGSNNDNNNRNVIIMIVLVLLLSKVEYLVVVDIVDIVQLTCSITKL